MRKTLAALGLVMSAFGACFIESETITGVEEGEVFSNKAELEALGVENISFHSFTTCTSIGSGDVLGTQYIVLNSKGEQVKLTPMGIMIGNC